MDPTTPTHARRRRLLLNTSSVAVWVIAATGFIVMHPGAAWLKACGVSGLGIVVVAQLVLLASASWRGRRGLVAASALVAIRTIGTWMAVYALGLYSPFCTGLGMGVLLAQISLPNAVGRASMAANYACYALLTAAVALGMVPRVGLFFVIPPAGTNFNVSVVVYALQLVVAGLSGARARALADTAERESRESAVAELERETLLIEARAALRKATRAGEPGRFTDHIIGGYRLGVVLGVGGMGEVYEAFDSETEEKAALKLLRLDVNHSARVIARFEREARIADRIGSKHVPRLLACSGASAELPFIAMEFLEGDDLASMLGERGVLTLEETAELVFQVCAGLDAVHKAGVVHRDLKPQNLLLQAGGKQRLWKILDFGVSALATDRTDLTRGTAVGTPLYMSPEQTVGGETGAPTDVYALAAVVYRALTGQSVAAGKNVSALFADIAKTLPLRPSTVADVPEAVDDVLRVGLAKAPKSRFQDARQFAGAFEQALGGVVEPHVARQAELLNAKLSWSEISELRSDRTSAGILTVPGMSPARRSFRKGLRRMDASSGSS